jgi:NTE family protein
MTKIGLALGGGIARGLAHIGVLKVFDEHGIKADVVAGTSMGAVIGAAYALGKSGREIERIALNLTWGRRAILWDVTVPRTGLIRGPRIKQFLIEHLSNVRFDQLKIPFVCVATDLMTGQEVLIEDGSVVEAVRASISIPAIFTPVERDGKVLVDGGLSSSVPVSAAQRLGAEFVIAVNVVPTPQQIAAAHAARSKQHALTIFDVLMHMNYVMSNYRIAGDLQHADVVIEPQLADVGAGDFGRVRECVARGEEATHRALERDKLAKLLRAQPR